MSELDQVDAGADSATATPEQTTDTSAGTQNTAPGPSPEQVPFHLHPRWQQVMAENRQYKQMVQGLSQRLQSLETASSSQGGLTHEQRAEYMKAGDALKTVLSEHPDLKVLLDLAKRAPHLMQASEGVQRLSQAQEQSIHRQARTSIADLAKAESLPAGPKALQFIEDILAGEIARMPNGRQRYLAGDISVVSEAFNAVKGEFFAHLRRDPSATVVDTKLNKVTKLPPRPAGGAISRDADPKLDPDNPKGFWKGLRERSRVVTQAGS